MRSFHKDQPAARLAQRRERTRALATNAHHSRLHAQRLLLDNPPQETDRILRALVRLHDERTALLDEHGAYPSVGYKAKP